MHVVNAAVDVVHVTVLTRVEVEVVVALITVKTLNLSDVKKRLSSFPLAADWLRATANKAATKTATVLRCISLDFKALADERLLPVTS